MAGFLAVLTIVSVVALVVAIYAANRSIPKLPDDFAFRWATIWDWYEDCKNGRIPSPRTDKIERMLGIKPKGFLDYYMTIPERLQWLENQFNTSETITPAPTLADRLAALEAKKGKKKG